MVIGGVVLSVEWNWIDFSCCNSHVVYFLHASGAWYCAFLLYFVDMASEDIEVNTK